MIKRLTVFCITFAISILSFSIFASAEDSFTMYDWEMSSIDESHNEIILTMNCRLDTYNPCLDIKINNSDEYIKSYKISSTELIIITDNIKTYSDFILQIYNLRDVYGRVMRSLEISFAANSKLSVSYAITGMRFGAIYRGDKLNYMLKFRNLSDENQSIFAAFDIKSLNKMTYLEKTDVAIESNSDKEISFDLSIPNDMSDDSKCSTYIWYIDNMSPITK